MTQDEVGISLSLKKPDYCDICDLEIKDVEDLCTLYLQGIKEKLKCHAGCIRVFMKCKGDWSKLPDGKLKRAIIKDQKDTGDTIVRNTGITIREKQGRHIMLGLKISKEEGYKRIEDLATIFYNLPKPNKEDNEFYSVDNKLQLVLMRKTNIEDVEDKTYKIIEASRE